MTRAAVRQARCILCGAPCDGRTCRAHDGIEVDAVPADPLESLPMQAAETQPKMIRARDVHTELDELAFTLQNASRFNCESPSNRALRMMIQRASVLDLLEQAVLQARNGTESC